MAAPKYVLSEFDAPTPKEHRFGYIPVQERSKKEQIAHGKMVDAMNPFFIAGQTRATDRKRVVVWDFWKKLDQKFLTPGKHIHTSRQNIGSCVGHGLYNALRSLMVMDRFFRHEMEQYRQIFEPYGYGRSRFHAGIRGRGSGSTGSGAAKGANQDGIITIDNPGLSGWTFQSHTVNWSAAVDTEWSDGARIDEKWLKLGREHLVQTVAPVRNYEQARDALANGYMVTVASNRGFRGFETKAGKLWGIPGGSWNHQMCFIGCDDDSSNPGLYDWNSWGADAHPTPADEAPPGGFWVMPEVCNYMLGQGDSFAFSMFVGFPESKIDLSEF